MSRSTSAIRADSRSFGIVAMAMFTFDHVCNIGAKARVEILALAGVLGGRTDGIRLDEISSEFPSKDCVCNRLVSSVTFGDGSRCRAYLHLSKLEQENGPCGE
jgi:hypothetical protein